MDDDSNLEYSMDDLMDIAQQQGLLVPAVPPGPGQILPQGPAAGGQVPAAPQAPLFTAQGLLGLDQVNAVGPLVPPLPPVRQNAPTAPPGPAPAAAPGAQVLGAQQQQHIPRTNQPNGPRVLCDAQPPCTYPNSQGRGTIQCSNRSCRHRIHSYCLNRPHPLAGRRRKKTWVCHTCETRRQNNQTNARRPRPPRRPATKTGSGRTAAARAKDKIHRLAANHQT